MPTEVFYIDNTGLMLEEKDATWYIGLFAIPDVA